MSNLTARINDILLTGGIQSFQEAIHNKLMGRSVQAIIRKYSINYE